MKSFSIDELNKFTTSLLVSKKIPQVNAEYIAEMAVRTEAMGILTHGLAVLGYLDNQVPDVFDPGTEPEIIKEKGASVLIDGKNGFSQLAMKLAIEMAMDKAGTMGIAMAAIRNTSWLGALGPYLESIARAGFMAQLWGQSSQCADCAPIGGITGKFSTNPVALAFPTSGDPVIADISTATVSMGAVNRMVKYDEKARARIFMDKNGLPTDDPNAMLDDGSIFFLGGPEYAHKGYGFSLWAEALTAMSGGSANNPDHPQSQNLNLTIIDIEAFGGMNYFDSEIVRFITHIKDTRLRPGFDAIRLPGERAFKSLKDSLQHGLSLSDAKLEMLNRMARKNGVSELK
ncbi:MAG: hypothetical protein DRP70_00070 [Spirochaetes bacterium]|nr:MAG: hypothetical protein DRP70_00070 [Spirochaetota bacterium]